MEINRPAKDALPVISEAFTYEEWKNDFLRVVLRFAAGVFFLISLTAFTSNTLATNILYFTLTTIIAIAAFTSIPYSARAFILLLTLFVAATNLLLIWGIEGEASMIYLTTISLATLLYEEKVEYLYLGLISITILAIAFMSINGVHTLSGWVGLGSEFYTAMVATWVDWVVYLVDVIAMGIILIYAIRLLKRKFNTILLEARRSLNELTDARNQMETRVTERTVELQSAVKLSDKRAQDLQTIAEISRYISIERDLEKLLPLITKIVCDRFGFYHVGIFLLDETKKFAVLRASNSPGGQEMLKRQHRLEVGQTGIVGNVTGTGTPRIALDTGTDSVFFNNPNLPETRSEMALPLTTRGSIIGALDVQSKIPNAFTDADISILSLLADQIAIAIENARLFEESQSALAESQSIFNEYISESWQKKARAGILGYYQSLSGGKIITDTTPSPEMEIKDAGGEKIMEVPIRVRDQIIGVLNVRAITADKEWTDDDLNVVQAVTERLGLALDNARLFEETSTRASRERLVTEITTRIRGTNDPEDMIKTAVVELQRALGATRVEIIPQKIAPPTDK